MPTSVADMHKRPSSQQMALRTTPAGQRPAWRFLTCLSVDSSPRRAMGEVELHRPPRSDEAHPTGGSTSEEILAAAAKFDWSAVAARRSVTPRGANGRHEDADFGMSSQPFQSFDVPSPTNDGLLQILPIVDRNSRTETPDERDGTLAGAGKRVSFAGDSKKFRRDPEKSPRQSGGLTPRQSGGLTPRQSLLSRSAQFEGRRTSQFAFEERLDVVRGVMTSSVEALLAEVPDFDDDQKRALRFLTDFREKAFQKEYPSLHPTSISSSQFNFVSGDLQKEERRHARQPKGPTRVPFELPKIIPKPPPATSWLEEKRQPVDIQSSSADISSAGPRNHVYLPLRELDDSHIQMLLPQQQQALAELAALGLTS